ncbi:transcriptional coactivator/pterin dehydratase [Nostoc sp. NIES-4103]|nr:transcriptional coactivator/pterin dehydratase [Nostoc sp. NIES-4103]
MTELAQNKCTACHKDAPRVTEDEIAELKPQIPDWKIVEQDEVSRLERIYKFADFQTALAFTQRVGEEAEKEGHHPALLTEWGKVTVTWWTHAIKGLHRNDFIMAAKTDQIAEAFTAKK